MPRDRELRDAIADVEMNLGLVLMMSRRIAKAEASFQRATSFDEGLAGDFPDDPRLLEHLIDRRLQIASWMDNFGMPRQAEQHRRELFAFHERRAASAADSSALAHSSAAAYHHRARSLGTLGRPREQQEAMRRALALEPRDPSLLNDLAESLVLTPDAPLQDSAEAIELAKRAVAAVPKEHTYWRTLGLAHLRAGQWPLAAQAIAKSMELQSPGGDASDYLLMAVISWRRDNKDAALDWYIRALDWLSGHQQSDASLLSLRAETERVLGRSPVADPRPKM